MSRTKPTPWGSIFKGSILICLIPALFAVAPPVSESAGRSAHELQSVSVMPGDTLWGIAEKYLKDPARWDEILEYNPQLSSDVTVALPGMTLKIPIRLIKKNLLAARLIEKVNKVLFRKKETAKWSKASKNMQLYRDDAVRTLANSHARVKFLNTDLLSLGPNSMAILKPLNKDYNVELKSAGTYLGTAKVLTATAKISPKTKDTKYLATVSKDLSTVVEVFRGRAEVEAEGKTVEVRAGMRTKIKVGKAPSIPDEIPDLPAFQARIARLGAPGAILGRAKMTIGVPGTKAPTGLLAEMSMLQVGEPVSGYRVQVSLTKDFKKIVTDKIVDVEEKSPASKLGLSTGRYWVRIATIDLLGSQGRFAKPKRYFIKNGKMTKIGN